MIQLKSFTLKSGVIQSPMAGCTDLAYRLLSRRYGMEFCFLEMVAAESLIRGNEGTEELMKTVPDDRPLGAQLMGCRPEAMAEAAQIAESLGYTLLASTSPRRKKLLRDAGIPFRTVKPLYEEKDYLKNPAALARAHALGKALSVAPATANGIIVSADTLVSFKGRIIGKPKNLAHARRILADLQGKKHFVCTGVVILKRKNGKTVFQKRILERTAVTLKKMSDAEIRTYFRRINPLDKAGSYAIQSRHSIVEKIDGLYSNAVGLPVEKIRRFLK